MSFRNKILLINAVLFLMFVALMVYGSILFVKGSYENQLASIKSSIIGQNTRVLETFVQSQDALFEEQARFILEEVKYLSLVFDTSCVRGYPVLEFIGDNLQCVNQLATDYIKGISYVDSVKNIEITLEEDGSTVIKPSAPNYAREWRVNTRDIYKFAVIEDDRMVRFYFFQRLKKNSEVLLKFEVDLTVFGRALQHEDLNSSQYRFLLVNEKGHFIASNWEYSFDFFLNSNIIVDGDKYPLRDYILSEKEIIFPDNQRSFSIISDSNKNYKIIHRKNSATGWRILLITPESYLHSSFVSTRDLILNSDNLLVEKITLSSTVLFAVFLVLIYITVVQSFRPINQLITQANFLKDRDFSNAMNVVYHNGDEIEVLSRAYSDAGKTIKRLVEGLENEVRVRTEQYEKAAQEAQDATKKKSTLLSNVSHEIRTPLNAIIGYAHMLKKDKYGEEHNHELEGINAASHTILGIVNDLLDFERLDAVNYTLYPKHVPINKIVRDVEKTFLPFAAQKNIELKVMKTGVGAAHQLFIDELRFQQALSNIISNAIKFTDYGQIEMSILTDTVQGQRMVVFAVRDTGRGIRKEDIDTIFNSFEQANQEDKQFGFGLGLAITKAIINLMGGVLVVESELGRGSLFKICLPIDALTDHVLLDDKDDGESENLKDPVVDENFMGMKALVVDDVEFNREILQFHLIEHGFECRTAIDGVDALDRLEKESFDVVLTDVSMPKMGGIELAQKSKALFPNLPIIAVTARATVQEEEKMRDEFDHYITKPIDETELFTALSITLHS